MNIKKFDHMNEKNKKRMEIAALVIIACTIWLLNSVSFMFTSEKVDAVISKIEIITIDDATFKIGYVDYSFNGRRYNDIKLDNDFPIKGGEGSHITIYCDPDNPKNIRRASTITFLPGLIIFVSLVAVFVIQIQHDEETHPELETNERIVDNFYPKEELIHIGEVVFAEVVDIECDYSITHNMTHPYIIECIYFDEKTANSYQFKSEPVWFNPHEFTSIGSKIKVIVNNNNYTNYYVDEDWLTSSFRPM